jgi:hypothetical protein
VIPSQVDGRRPPSSMWSATRRRGRPRPGWAVGSGWRVAAVGHVVSTTAATLATGDTADDRLGRPVTI